ncbi:hypothetical protein TKK_0018400 [Trichogramma kaykai]
MSRLRLTSAFLALLVVATNGQWAPDFEPRNITSIETIHLDPKIDWKIFNPKSARSGRFSFFECESKNVDGKINCQVVFLIFLWDGRPKGKKCPLTLNLGHQGLTIEHSLVVPTHNRHVIVSWYEPKNVRGELFVVRMDDCHVAKVDDSRVKEYRPKDFIEYDDRISVLADLSTNGVEDLAHFVIDLDGKVIERPTNWSGFARGQVGSHPFDVVPVSPLSGSDGLMTFEWIPGVSRVDVKMGRYFPQKKEYTHLRLFHVEPLRNKVVYSNANGYLSYCLGFENRISCFQYDNQTLRQQFPVAFVNVPHVHLKHLALHNLPGGGFLLSVGNCPSEDPLSCETLRNTYDVHEFNACGHYLGKTADVPRPKCGIQGPFPTASLFFENYAGDYCIMEICNSPTAKSNQVVSSSRTCLSRGAAPPDRRSNPLTVDDLIGKLKLQKDPLTGKTVIITSGLKNGRASVGLPYNKDASNGNE